MPPDGGGAAHDGRQGRCPHAAVILYGAVNVAIKAAVHDGEYRVWGQRPELPHDSGVGRVV